MENRQTLKWLKTGQMCISYLLMCISFSIKIFQSQIFTDFSLIWNQMILTLHLHQCLHIQHWFYYIIWKGFWNDCGISWKFPNFESGTACCTLLKYDTDFWVWPSQSEWAQPFWVWAIIISESIFGTISVAVLKTQFNGWTNHSD